MGVLLWRLAVFVAALCPPLWWLYQAWIFALGPDPGKALVDKLGTGALVLLLLTLSLTPLSRLTRWKLWPVIRRQLGLWTFTYALLHFLGYLAFVLGFDLSQLGVELQRRPYIIVGAAALLILLALAVTSNRPAMRRLGKRWKELHRLAYLVLGLGLLHYLWIVRSDLEEWAIYATIGAALLAFRLVDGWRRKRRSRAATAPAR